MSEALCWKCIEKWHINEKDDKGYIKLLPDWAHCHHEPKEKPKCWCEYKFKSVFAEAGDKPTHAEWVDHKANFCPECGRKL